MSHTALGFFFRNVIHNAHSNTEAQVVEMFIFFADHRWSILIENNTTIVPAYEIISETESYSDWSCYVFNIKYVLLFSQNFRQKRIVFRFFSPQNFTSASESKYVFVQISHRKIFGFSSRDSVSFVSSFDSMFECKNGFVSFSVTLATAARWKWKRLTMCASLEIRLNSCIRKWQSPSVNMRFSLSSDRSCIRVYVCYRFDLLFHFGTPSSIR